MGKNLDQTRKDALIFSKSVPCMGLFFRFFGPHPRVRPISREMRNLQNEPDANRVLLPPGGQKSRWATSRRIGDRRGAFKRVAKKARTRSPGDNLATSGELGKQRRDENADYQYANDPKKVHALSLRALDQIVSRRSN